MRGDEKGLESMKRESSGQAWQGSSKVGAGAWVGAALLLSWATPTWHTSRKIRVHRGHHGMCLIFRDILIFGKSRQVGDKAKAPAFVAQRPEVLHARRGRHRRDF